MGLHRNFPRIFRGAIGRFSRVNGTKAETPSSTKESDDSAYYYKLARPGMLWNGIEYPPLAANGGQTRNSTEDKVTKLSPPHQQTDDSSASSFCYDAPHSHTLWNGVEETRLQLNDDEFKQSTDINASSEGINRKE